MTKKKIVILFICLLPFFTLSAFSQDCRMKGRIYNNINNEAVPFAVVVLKDGSTTYPATSDTSGNYLITVPKPGLYNIEVIMTGFKPYNKFETELLPQRVTELNIALEENSKALGEITIIAQSFIRKEESPLSMRSIGVAEIKRNPGGNRDISKVLQSLPGVAAVPSFRNDLIVRGGSPNENRFYLDGIEIPNINHFATQGASGGPVGMLNVDFINEADFYSGAFPSNKGNALSSVLDLKFKDGRNDKAGMTFTLGATDLAATFDGPISSKSSLIASYRRSYLAFLFDALGLPFLPTYNDFQFKYKYKPDNKHEFSFLGLGAYDVFVLNKIENPTEEQLYQLGNIPENTQWNYTVGGSYKRYSENSFITLVLSRNHLNNKAEKYYNNDKSLSSNKILDYTSEETENKFRLERTTLKNSWRTNAGISLEQSSYSNTTFNQIPNVGTVNYNSEINFLRYGLFGQLSKTFSNVGLVLSLGARMDANSYGENMENPLEQFSPRLSLSKVLTERLTFNANTGIYYQVPAYTILGYRNNNNELVNTGIKPIRCGHVVAGFEYQNKNNARLTLEGFYKVYSHYPFGLFDSLSIANQGSDFGVIGDEPVDSRSEGISYGIEFLLQQKLYKGIYGLVSYTFAKSEFTNLDSDLTSSSWDFRHTLSFTIGKTFAKNWEAGLRFRYNSGSPYTPYNVYESSLRENWDISGQGILDYNKVNQNLTEVFYQLDVRIDKKYYYKSWSLNVFLDIQNIFNTITQLAPYLDVERDATGSPIVNPNDSTRYLVKQLDNNNGNILPTIGIIVTL